MILIILILFNLFCDDFTEFSADKYINQPKTNSLTLEGNVSIINNSNTIKANEVKINTQTNDFTARGEVIYKSKDTTIKSNNLKANLKSEIGYVENGTITTTYDTFYGDKIFKKSPSSYEIESGIFTSCKTDPADWSIYGKNMDLDLKGYAKIDNAVLETFDVPLLYLPYIVMPLKKERQTGLLMPHFSFTSEGFNIEDDLFVVISRSSDVTFTLGNYEKRGIKKGIEYRTVFSKDSYFNSYLFNINDDFFANTLYQGEPIGITNRYSFKSDSVFKLDENAYFKSQIRYASDDSIPRDFINEIDGNAEPALESRFFAYNNTDNFLYSASINYYQNLLDNNPTATNTNQIQKLPELSIKMAKYKYGIFMFENDLSYLNIYRSGLPYDDTNNNSAYDSGETIRTGQRLDFYPRATIPIVTDYFTISPTLGFRYNYYKIPELGNSDKANGEAKVNLSTDIFRTYTFSDTSSFKSLKHIINPYSEYVYVNELIKKDPSTPDFDSIDTIDAQNYIKYGINNRIIANKRTKITTKKDIKTCLNCTEEKEKEKEKNTNNLIESKNEKENNDEYSYSIIQPITWDIYQYYDIDKKKMGNLYSKFWYNYDILNIILTNYLNIDNNKIATSANATLKFNKYYYTNLIYTVDKTKDTSQVDQFKLGFGFSIWYFYSNVRFIYNNMIDGSIKDKIQEKYIDVSFKPKSSCWFITTSFTNRYDKIGTEINFVINFIISGQEIGLGNDMDFLNTM